MFATDFIFNGELASDYNLVICSINGNDIETSPNGASITPVQVKSAASDVWQYIRGNYDEALSATIQVIKKSCDDSYDNAFFSVYEQREINRWLNKRDGFHEFKLIKEGFDGIVFNAQINVNKVELMGKVIGFELNIITDKPYAYFDEVTEYINSSASSDKHFILFNNGDEDGEIDTIVKVTCLNAGTLRIYNEATQKSLILSDCEYDETVYFDSKKREVKSNRRTAGQLLDKFNFGWIKLKRENGDGTNVLTINMDANIEVKYSPIAKISF